MVAFSCMRVYSLFQTPDLVCRWRKGSLSKSMSMSHEAAARAVKKLGLDSAAQHNPGYGLPMIDIAIEAEDQDVALMVCCVCPVSGIYLTCTYPRVHTDHHFACLTRPPVYGILFLSNSNNCHLIGGLCITFLPGGATNRVCSQSWGASAIGQDQVSYPPFGSSWLEGGEPARLFPAQDLQRTRCLACCWPTPAGFGNQH